jgi:endonuclease/exonuclease/phosphatase family metal-dependent hydrolase
MQLRLATYNVEWFDALFDEQGYLQRDTVWSRRHNITRAQQIKALGTVVRRIDADAIMVVEAPDTSRQRNGVRALQRFAQVMGIRARKAQIGFVNDTQQEIILLYDPDVLHVRHAPRSDPDAPRFDGSLLIDLDVNETKEEVRFSKPPLEVELTLSSGQKIQVIGAHLKSKAPHGAKTPAEVMAVSIANRHKQLVQAIWLRRRISAHLSRGSELILLGDLNDGPGLDAIEALFGKSSVEILMGADNDLFDPHASDAMTRSFGACATTSRFYLSDRKRYAQALLDYAMVSPGLRHRAPSWRIWHPFDDPECWEDKELRNALLAGSDHFPVTVELAI